MYINYIHIKQRLFHGCVGTQHFFTLETTEFRTSQMNRIRPLNAILWIVNFHLTFDIRQTNMGAVLKGGIKRDEFNSWGFEFDTVQYTFYFQLGKSLQKTSPIYIYIYIYI